MAARDTGVDTLIVERKDFTKSVLVHQDAAPPLGEGQLLVRVEVAALTSNTITYAVVGDHPAMQYFAFFPRAEQGFASVPCWGVGVVEASRHPDVKVGEKLYGFFTMSNLVVLSASKVKADSLMDLSPHRKDLSPIYNTYNRLDSGMDNLHIPGREEYMIVMRPLFLTAYLLASMVKDKVAEGGQAILTSASSKTSYSLAFLLKRAGIPVVGLTSPRNEAFVRSLHTYDQVVVYPAIGEDLSSDPQGKTVLVDMAGSDGVVLQVLARIPDAFVSKVGMTHWDSEKDATGAAKGELFFAPAEASKVVAASGAEAFQAQVGEAYRSFVEHAAKNEWCKLTHCTGPEAVKAAYDEVSLGSVDPREGVVIALDSAKSRI